MSDDSLSKDRLEVDRASQVRLLRLFPVINRTIKVTKLSANDNQCMHNSSLTVQTRPMG